MAAKSPFDVVRDLTEKTAYCPTDFPTNTYMVNMILSMDEKLIFVADEVNRMQHVSDKMKYDFLFNMIPKGKKYIKYIKKNKEEKNTKDDEKIEEIMRTYQVSAKRAREYFDIIKNRP